MKAVAILSILACALLLEKESPETFKAVKASEVQWVDAVKQAPRGVKNCVLHGDPSKGAFVMLAKFPAGTVVAPHTHSTDEVVSIVSGTFVIGSGEKVDEPRGKVVDAGGYFTIKAKTPHWAVAKTETVLVRYGNGPADIQFVNPADDPAKK
jgi:quercetin dioxygenase-like cupin family protein